MAKNDIEIVKGARLEAELTVTDESSNPVDLTGSVIYVTVASKLCPDTPDIALNSDDNPTQVFLKPQAGATLGKAGIVFLPDDTEGMKPRDYKYDVWVVFDALTRYAPINDKVFTVKGAVTCFP